MIKKYWLSCRMATVYVETENDVIVDIAPIFKIFLRQPFSNLVEWLARKKQTVDTVELRS